MRTEVVMPQMGESVTEGTLTSWLKKVGDFVERDEPLFEITTDKVDAEVPSPVAGVLLEQLVAPGTTVEINTLVAIVDAQGAAAAPMPAASAPAASAPVSAASPAPLATAPVLATAASPVSASLGLSASPVSLAALKPSEDSEVEALHRSRSTPLVRRIAAEHGIDDLTGIPGTGINGRVTKQDILGYLGSGAAKAAPVAQAAPAPAPQAQAPQAQAPAPKAPLALPAAVIGARDRVEPMSPQRLAIARHMVASRATSAHAHTVHEVDFGAVSAAREALRRDFEARGVKLTFTAFMVQAFAQALAELPLVNASVEDDQIIYRGDIHIGVAVALADSLIVPVIKHVDELSLLGISRAINDLAERARTKRLKPEEVKGGTFTVSNHGIFGAEFGVPVINQPQVAIVSTGAIKKRVVVDQDSGAILVRPTSIFCMSFDHRVIDGATADRFMARVRALLETWS